MALGYLFILYIVMIVISGLGIGFLCLSKNAVIKNICFYGLVVWGIIVAYMGVTSQPTNFIAERMFFVATGALALIGVLVKHAVKAETIAKILVIASVVISVVNMLFF